MLSVYLNASRDGKNRTHKAFSTAILLFLRVSKPIGLGFSGGGALYWQPRSPAVLLGKGHMGNVGQS